MGGIPNSRSTLNLNDEDVIRRARSGDEAALRTLYETHRPRVMRLAYSLLGDADEAEDVTQDVLIYALNKLDRYDPSRAAFTTWLHMITVSRCRDRARRARTALASVTGWLRGSRDQVAPDPESRLDRLDAASRIGPALAKLTPLQREALVLREVEELSFAEIGTVLDVPMRTAQARVTSAYAALRQSLGATTAAGTGKREADHG
jgi:RNA polymerase sigma-70 factor (ECF subfamily)